MYDIRDANTLWMGARWLRSDILTERQIPRDSMVSETSAFFVTTSTDKICCRITTIRGRVFVITI